MSMALWNKANAAMGTRQTPAALSCVWWSDWFKAWHVMRILSAFDSDKREIPGASSMPSRYWPSKDQALSVYNRHTKNGEALISLLPQVLCLLSLPMYGWLAKPQTGQWYNMCPHVSRALGACCRPQLPPPFHRPSKRFTSPFHPSHNADVYSEKKEITGASSSMPSRYWPTKDQASLMYDRQTKNGGSIDFLTATGLVLAFSANVWLAGLATNSTVVQHVPTCLACSRRLLSASATPSLSSAL